MSPVAYILAALIGYAFGGIPTGILVARARHVDLTQVGSKKTGATNVLRTLGPAAAAVVFAGDFLKAVVAVSLVSWLFGDSWANAVAAVAAVVGHGFSPYIGFRGGRGVTPGLGGLLVVSWWIFLIALLVGVIVIALTRFVSLGSLLGTIVAALVIVYEVAVWGWPAAYMLFGLGAAAFIVASHHDNIQRLLAGRERKLGEPVQT